MLSLWLLCLLGMLHTSSGQPSLTTLSPPNGAVAVSGTSTVIFTFDQAVQAGHGDIVFTPSSLATSDQYVPILRVPVTAATFGATSLSVSPGLGATGARYTVTYASGVLQNISGAAVPALSTGAYSFTTNDTQPPAIVMFAPSAGTAVRHSDTAIVVAFDEHVLAGSGNISMIPVGGSGYHSELQIPVSSLFFNARSLTVDVPLSGIGGVTWLLYIPPGAVVDANGNNFPGLGSNQTTRSQWEYWIIVKDPSAPNPASMNHDPPGFPQIQFLSYGTPPKYLTHQHNSVTPATNRIPRVANLTMSYKSLKPLTHFTWIGFVATHLSDSACQPTVAGRYGNMTPGGDRTPPIALSSSHNTFGLTQEHLSELTDSGVEYAVCFAAGNGSSGDTSWWDSMLRFSVSAISHIEVVSTSEHFVIETHHTVPRERDLRFHYDSGVLPARQWISLVAWDQNDKQPCTSKLAYAPLGSLDGVQRENGAVVVDTLWSGAFQAGQADRIVFLTTVPIVPETDFAVCYGSYDRHLLDKMRWALEMGHRDMRAAELALRDTHTLALMYLACETEVQKSTLLQGLPPVRKAELAAELQGMSGYRHGWHDSGLRVRADRSLENLLATELPTLSAPRYVTMGSPIVVHFNSGPLRPMHSQRDWIGLFRKGECDAEDVLKKDHWVMSDRHECYLQRWNVPGENIPQSHVTFEAEAYLRGGDYEARYFYGDDPSALGAFSWRAQGYVCNTWSAPPRPVETVDSSGTVDNSFASSGDSNRTGYLQNRGLNTAPEMTSMSVEQCSCDPAAVKSRINILKSDYGENCMSAADPAAIQFPVHRPEIYNQTDNLARACNGRDRCDYHVDETLLGNPVPSIVCPKWYRVWWTCSGTGVCPDIDTNPGHACHKVVTKTETHDQILSISCPQENAREQCKMWRAACGSCALDAVATSEPITVMPIPTTANSHGERHNPWQNTDGVPGFEWP